MEDFIKEINEMNLEQITKRKAEIEAEIRNADKIESLDGMEKKIEEVNKRIAYLQELETRKNDALKIQNGIVQPNKAEERGNVKMDEKEMRAKAFAESGKMEVRAVLSTGSIAKPTKAASEVSGTPDVASDIVDDVRAVALTGNGAWTVPYKKTDASAADVTDGNTVGGTAATFDVVTINPGEWGVLDSVSNQVKKMSPVNYAAAVEESALIALRDKASAKIVAAVKASTLTQKRVSIALDDKYIRDLVTGFRANKKKGAVCLYLNQTDLSTLGKVRGTNEKKAVYDIQFDEGVTTSGMIKDGGTAVRFRVLDQLTTGEQMFGQPKSIDMPMWDGYEIKTDESVYFDKNLIAIRGLQTAGADLVVYHGMQLIHQAST